MSALSHDELAACDCEKREDWLVGPERGSNFETASRAHMPKMTRQFSHFFTRISDACATDQSHILA